MPASDHIHDFGVHAPRAWLVLIDRLDKTYEGVRGEGETLEVAAARTWREAEGYELGKRRSDDEIVRMDFTQLARRDTDREVEGQPAPQPEKPQSGWLSGFFGAK